MSQAALTPNPQSAMFAPEEILRQLDALKSENAELGRELLRCYEQLNLVFEITEHIATLHDPATIRDGLIRRYASMLGASALFIDDSGHCTIARGVEPAARQLTIEPAHIRLVLRDDIEHTRRTQRVHVPVLTEVGRAALQGAHALLGPIRQMDAPVVVIALRAPEEAPFDSSDMLASESVLGYGGHILNNVLMGRHLQQTAIETVRALANAIDAKDNYTSGHSERVGWLSRLTAEALTLPPSELQAVEWGGLLHDVGKIGVPEHILNKPGKLTDEEFAEIKKHPRIGYEVLRPVSRFGPVLDAVLYHHENHDGSGYPQGLRGEEIPLSARIVHVVDIFDALTSSRSYRASFSVEKAIEILRKDSGRVTDPHISDIFIQAFERYRTGFPADFVRRFGHLISDAAPNPETSPSGGTIP